MQKEHIKIWNAFFSGNEATDYTGRLIKKEAYGQTGSMFGWVIELINPYRETTEDNIQIVSIYANAVRNGRICYAIDGTTYQIKRIKGTPTFQVQEIRKDIEEDFWQREFGNATTSKDFCGRKIKKADFGNSKSELGWNIDHIMPRANGGDNSFGNIQLANIKSNAEKADKITFKANGKTYQVRKNKASLDLKNENYDYAEKDYCVVAVIEQPKSLTPQQVWTHEFGNATQALDYDESKIYKNKPSTWVIEQLNPDGDWSLSNIHIVEKSVHEIRGGRPTFSIYDKDLGSASYYRLRKNDGSLSRKQMSDVYDYSNKDYYLERYDVVFDDDDSWDD